MKLYKKLFVMLILGTVFVCTGCGKDTVNEQNFTQKETPSAEDTEKIVSSRQSGLTIQSITVNKDTRSMQVAAEYSGENKDDLEQYSITDAFLDMQVKEESGNIQVIWSGFYDKDSAYENLDIRKGYASVTAPAEEVEYKSEYHEITYTDCAKFETTAGKGTAAVSITPFTVTIQPSQDWREDGTVYHVLAVMKNGDYQGITRLPSIDDRKTAEKKEHTLSKVKLEDGSELDPDTLEILGTASQGGMVLENDSYRFAVTETIPVNEIKELKIVPYVSE